MWTPATWFQIHSSALILCGYVNACLTDGLSHLSPLVFESEVLITAASSAFSEVEALGHYSFLANIQFWKRVQELVQSTLREWKEFQFEPTITQCTIKSINSFIQVDAVQTDSSHSSLISISHIQLNFGSPKFCLYLKTL